MLRTVVIESPGHLFVKHKQLMLRQDGELTHVGSFEDIGWILLEHPHLTLTQAVVAEAALNNTVVIFCNKQFHPSSLAIPLEGNSLQGERQRNQVEAPIPRKKAIWKQIVQSKIQNQGALLSLLDIDGQPVKYLVSKVRSGDPENVEATAARRYWPLLFGHEFRRNNPVCPPNAALNYGYAILRSCAVRMLVSTGLNPSIGVHHKSRYNAFALADDMMEVYRPWVDRIVWSLFKEEKHPLENLDTFAKKALLEVLQHDVLHIDEIKPLGVSMRQYAVEIGNMLTSAINRLPKVEIISLNYEDHQIDGLEMD